MATIISGREVSEEIKARLKERVERLGLRPTLAVVQVGNREDSNVYIRMKVKFAEDIGGKAQVFKMDNQTTEDQLLNQVDALNRDPNVHGIIVQLPFDSVHKINADKVTNLIDPDKDVDGLSDFNAGKLLHGQVDGKSSFVPCTPAGCLELIRKAGVRIDGSTAVVIGRSKIVGAPMSQLLVWHNATVITCHSHSTNTAEMCRLADIIVVAVGVPNLVKRDWVKSGAVVIDCGITSVQDASRKSGTRLVGDVDYEAVKEVAGAITPVPGGVGPMTVAMLISNTVDSAERMSLANKKLTNGK